jgi:hypothetical protein
MAIATDFLKSMSLNPEEILSKEAQAMPHRTILTCNSCLSEQGQIQLNLMLRALIQKLKQRIIAETQATNQKTV